jgi:dTDP-4-dehydrorhamnose 3,5-epimerase
MATVTESDVIAGVYIVEPVVHRDQRGSFVETYRREWFPRGLEMVQGNRGDREQGCVVGLHYHLHQADYWYVPMGRALVVLHDLRVGSPTDGATLTIELGARPDGTHDHRGVLIPPGVAHGFESLTDMTIMYLVDSYYNPADELGVAWDDPEIAAGWATADPVLSKRDMDNPRRADLPPEWRPHYGLRV